MRFVSALGSDLADEREIVPEGLGVYVVIPPVHVPKYGSELLFQPNRILDLLEEIREL